MLDTRTRNTIARHFCANAEEVTPEALSPIPWWYLRRIPGIGLKSMHGIKAWMGEAGYRYSPKSGWKRDAIEMQ